VVFFVEILLLVGRDVVVEVGERYDDSLDKNKNIRV
jgi:hypothetical protein